MTDRKRARKQNRYRGSRLWRATVIDLVCPCCSETVQISQENFDRIYRAAGHLLGTGGLALDISRLPDGVNWLSPLSEEEVKLSLGAFSPESGDR